MSELLQEYVDSRHERLLVDRTVGVIRGVKLLGLNSRNGRRYREEALAGAIGLYEGVKVNINHPKGHPLAPRDYQDRLGMVRGVELRAGEGLFGDLHFNPKHALSEQLVWDAEHAPQNVGMSHNVLARTKREGEGVVVEAITKVQSIDLVADPATTSGLYEQVESQESRVKSREPDAGDSGVVLDSKLVELGSLSLDELRRHRPELIAEVEQGYEAQLEEVRRRLEEMIAKEQWARRRDYVLRLLQEHDLPLPTSGPGDDKGDAIVSERFVESLMKARDEGELRQLVEERAALVRSAARWDGNNRRDRRPRSRQQLSVPFISAGSPRGDAAEFAAALRGA
jgi:hypothetical protein